MKVDKGRIIVMTRVRPSELESGEEKKLLQMLYKSIAELKGEKEITLFLEQLFTRSESIMFARRIEIAALLLAGESYEEIQIKTKAGSATIARIQKWLDIEGQQCSKSAIKSLEGKFNKVTRQQKTGSSATQDVFDDIRERYPLQFLLFNLFIENKRK